MVDALNPRAMLFCGGSLWAGQLCLPRMCRAPICSVGPLRTSLLSSDQLAMCFFGYSSWRSFPSGTFWKQTFSRTGTSRMPHTIHLTSPTTLARSRQCCRSARLLSPASWSQLRYSPAARSPGFSPASSFQASSSFIWSLVLPSSVVPGSLPSYWPWMGFVRRHEGSLRLPLWEPLGTLLGR